MINRLYVEKINDVAAKSLEKEIRHTLNIGAEIKRFLRYDISGLDASDLKKTIAVVFSEPPVDRVFFELTDVEGFSVFAVEYLPGQYDQRADSACQCVQFVTAKERPTIRCATVYAVKGVSGAQLVRIKNYLINPVEAREASLALPKSLALQAQQPKEVETLHGFVDLTFAQIQAFHKENGFAMTERDLEFVRDYFKSENRNPTITEIKVIDTYWSDHCRHTTFSTELKNIVIKSGNPNIQKALDLYNDLFRELYSKRQDKYPCLMDIATIAVKKLKKEGLLDDLDESDEINACSICVTLEENGKNEEYLVMFKNETHNHPTEIEPFGGAATCLGGAIRDPLSGRTYVYHAMRVTGSADPTADFSSTIKGKLPQRVITTTAAHGFSSYGNQIGLATGIVAEMYHPDYVAKRLETGFVVGANKKKNVKREKPIAGDVVILLGGETGRDGCGGATGSSKAHTADSIEVCGAEVQKGNALTERKIQRLFKNPSLTRLIKKCNDFGAGGVCVAIGELADGIDIDLSLVPKKYEGLGGTELAISESQERMAVVISATDEERFISLCKEENLGAVCVARITDTRRMRMTLCGKTIVDISRDFLDTNGVRIETECEIVEGLTKYLFKPCDCLSGLSFEEKAVKTLGDLNVCSKKGLSEMFDSTIGAGTVFMPFGGKNQLTPALSMAAKIPTENHQSTVSTVAAWGCNPYLLKESPFVGSQHSIATSVAKVVASGCDYRRVRLTLQEYFKRLNMDKTRFGEPLSALLGALSVQIGLGLGAIGGKDSMSGTFENIDVPPTLISFALATEKAENLTTNVIKKAKQKLYQLPLKRDEYGCIDFEYAKKLFAFYYDNKQDFATVIEHGGAFAAVAKSCFGNGFGFDFIEDSALFTPSYGDIICDIDSEKAKSAGLDCILIGETTSDKYLLLGKEKIAIEVAIKAFEGKLSGVFKTTAPSDAQICVSDYSGGGRKHSSVVVAKPRVFIPVFPGTNCEIDTAEKFVLAGGEADIFVVKNQSQSEIEQSILEIEKRIKMAQIIAFPGGFSGGDEPDGSGKFIVATFRNPRISEALTAHIQSKDGLVLGICNGFQAIIKLGLLQYGMVKSQDEASATLTYNNISRHISTLVNIRVGSNLSPWLSGVKVGDVYSVAVSHGEGKLIAPTNVLRDFESSGQIATQYVDDKNQTTSVSPFNPNGSYYAIEGLTSKCGRVYGKMGHTERAGKELYKNFDGNFDMKLFESGIKYFK